MNTATMAKSLGGGSGGALNSNTAVTSADPLYVTRMGSGAGGGKRPAAPGAHSSPGSYAQRPIATVS